jgi:hypothetical protein
MPALASDSELKNVLPELIQRKNVLRDKAKALGITFIIAADGGLRTPERTKALIGYRDADVAAAGKAAEAAAKKAGLSPADTVKKVDAARTAAYYRVAPVGTSFHEVGAGFDINITRRPVGMSWENGYKALGELAQSIGLRWGGYFSAPKDVFHFELREPRSVYAAQYAAALKSTTATASRGTALGLLLVVAAGAALYYYGA